MNEGVTTKLMSQLSLEMNRLRFKWRKNLLTRDKAPTYLCKSNPHIYDGFRLRKKDDTTLGCFFFWSNETLNIWTHVVGALVFIHRLVQIVQQDLFPDRLDRFLIVVELFCLIFSMASSATCHAFCHISEDVYRFYEKTDVMGIVLCTTAGFFNLIHYFLQCYPLARNVYALMVVVCSTLLVRAVNRKNSVFSKDNGNTFQRILAFLAWSMFALIPVVHWLYLEGTLSNVKVMTFLPRILTVYALGISAAAFFATQYPECSARGQYDFVGQSHQIWHVLIFCCMYYWHVTLEALIVFLKDHPCS